MGRTNPFKLKQAAVKLVSAPPLYSTEPIITPGMAVRVMANELKDLDREVVAILNLKTNMQPINFSIASMGTLNSAIIKPRELLKNVFLSNANGIIMIHNHPSGSLNPSKEDIAITDQMIKLCSLAGVDLYDHIIIGAGNLDRYYSMKIKGEMSFDAVRFSQDINALQWSETAAAEPRTNYEENKTSVLKDLKEIKEQAQEKPKKNLPGKDMER